MVSLKSWIHLGCDWACYFAGFGLREVGGVGGCNNVLVAAFKNEHTLHATFPTLHVTWKTFLMLRS